MEQESKLYISASIAKSLPSMVKNELAKMPAHKQEEFVEEFKRKEKSLGIAYLFFIIYMHYGYLRKWEFQVVFLLTLGGFGIWVLIDLFRIPSLVKDYNKDVATDTMRNLKIMSS